MRACVQHARVVPVHTEAFERSNGGILNLHTGVFRVPSRVTHTTHTQQHITHHRLNPTHNLTHKPTPHITTQLSTPQHQNTKRPSHTGSQHMHYTHDTTHDTTHHTTHITHHTHKAHTPHCTHNTHTHTNAWICAPSTTDHDLETNKMLGYVHRGQQIMNLFSIKICICNVCNFFMRIYCFGITVNP